MLKFIAGAALFVVLASFPTVPFAQAADVTQCKSITVKSLMVDAKNDEWTTAQTKAQPGDLIIIMADGEAILGNWLGKVGPAGFADNKANPAGRLEMKVGTGTVLVVGARWVGEVDVAGALKFRINDTTRGDNAGGYRVTLMVVPRAAIPPPVVVEAD